MKKITFTIIAIAIVLTVFSGCAEGAQTAGACNSYKIEATYDEATRTLLGSETVQVVNCYDVPLPELRFRLYGNAYRDQDHVPASIRDRAYYKGESVGETVIESVRLNDTKVAFSLSESGESLIIPLDEELFPDERIKVQIKFKLTLAEAIARLGVTPNSVHLTHWYPVLACYENGEILDYEFFSVGDPFMSESSNYDVSITVPADMVSAGGGKVERIEEHGETKTVTYSAKKTRDFALVLSRGFKTVSALSGGTLVTYYYLSDENPAQTLSTAQTALTYFSSVFGTYPYTTFSLVETDFLHDGMEYGALAMISSETASRERTVIHETAHQWWYGIVGNNPVTHAFMDEGLAEYSTYLYYLAHGRIDEASRMIEEAETSYALFFDVMRRVTGKADTSMTRRLDEYLSSYEYVNVCYNKGFLMFQNLSLIVGRQNFISGLKRYASDHKYGMATLLDMVASIENGSSRHVEGIISQWVDGRVAYYVLD